MHDHVRGQAADQVTKTDEEWRAQLSPEEYAVLRQAGTERAWTGEYVDTKTVGVYECRACGAELFRSETKFDSHCGWPSFYEASAEDNVILREDRSYGMVRTEVLCGTCHSHLGHLFDDAPQTPTGDRYCINSVSHPAAAGRGLTPQVPLAPIGALQDSMSPIKAPDTAQARSATSSRDRLADAGVERHLLADVPPRASRPAARA